jgi:hypothetical protein
MAFYAISAILMTKISFFGVSSACGAGNTKIGFIMRIADAVSSFVVL